MPFGTLVGVMSLVSAFVAGDLLKRRGNLLERWRRMIGCTVFIIVTTTVIHGVDVVAVLQATHILFAGVRLVSKLTAIVARGKFLM